MVGRAADRRHLPSGLAGLVAVLLVALAAALPAGLATGAAYGRYIAIQGLLEERTPATVDGSLEGLRATVGVAPAEVAYVGGHYYLTEGPLTTWLAAPLYALGAWLAQRQPGAGWAPALTGLLGPLLLLALLLGLVALGRGHRLAPLWPLLAMLSTLLLWPLVPAAATQSPWLLPAALAIWLLVGLGWRRRWWLLLHGLLAGGLIGLSPWFAPTGLLALLAPIVRGGYADWRGAGWRLLGLIGGLLPVAVWQWLLFGRPWRTAAQLGTETGGPWLAAERLVPLLTLLVLGGAIVVLAERRWVAAIILCLPLGLAAAGAPPPTVGLLIGVAGAVLLVSNPPLGAGRWRLVGVFDTLWLFVLFLWYFWSGPAIYHQFWSEALLAVPIIEYGPLQRLVPVGLVTLIGLLAWLTGRQPVRAGLALLTLGLLGLAAGAGLLLTAPVVAAEGQPANLLPPFESASADGGVIQPWRSLEGAEIVGGRLRLPTAAARAESGLVAVRPGERYCAAVTPAVGTLLFAWQDDGHQPLAQQGSPAGSGRRCFAAPPSATGLRLLLTGGPAPIAVEAVHLWSDGPRIAPLPDYATAALAFTFDWESTMGGLIHSKGGSTGDEGEKGGTARDDDSRALAIAVERGERMRRGGEILADLFRPAGIRATFYSTGYNLLTGNTERRQFAGNPTYRWASVQNRWASNYWLTHPWFGDDPYGTEQSHPQWYFGQLSQRLASEGHEIETHTFGHLYVRGTSPDELATDLAEWNRAAQALGLPRARSFAFPWQSSNSVREPHYRRLTEAGITSVTRVYPQVYRQQPWLQYELDEVEGMPGLLIYPDIELKSNATGGARARQAIDEVLLRRGYLSLWTHPEEVVDPPQVAVWRATIDYAVAARDRGLWIAPLVEILDQVRTLRRVTVIRVRDGTVTTLRLTNGGAQPARGLTIEHGLTATAERDGLAWDDLRAERLRLPSLAAGQTSVVRLTSGTGR